MAVYDSKHGSALSLTNLRTMSQTGKTSNSKLQTPDKLQASKPKALKPRSKTCHIPPFQGNEVHNINRGVGAWCLKILWSLKFGVWSFRFCLVLCVGCYVPS